MADLSGGELVARVLKEAGVAHVFTLCGGHIFGEARAVGTALPQTRYDSMVEALGGRGVLVTEPSGIGPALTQALASDEVWCINVLLDPEAYRKSSQVSMAI